MCSRASTLTRRLLTQCFRYLRSVTDPETKAKWTRVKEDLTAEFRIIQDLANELNNFKVRCV